MAVNNDKGIRAVNQKVTELKKKETPTQKKITESRRNVIRDLYFNQSIDPVEIRNLLLREKRSDWTTTEIVNHMKSIGIPKDQIERVTSIGII